MTHNIVKTSKKICLVTCYKDPNYVRVKTLEAGLRLNDVDLTIVRNNHKGILRYPEVVLQLIKTRITINPDAYIVTFRGYEILPVVLLIGFGKKVIFDEFINLIEWIVYEHKKLKSNSLRIWFIKAVYKLFLKSTTLIITDTNSHARYSAELMGIPIEKYQSVSVGTDETISNNKKLSGKKNNSFQIIYYGSMLPLHGIEYVIQAAIEVADNNIEFFLIGGGHDVQRDIRSAISKGARIKYKKWVPYDKLSALITNADVCLGGPFGNTVQARFVITGKTFHFLRMGKPVIVGRNLESKVFDDKVNALLVDRANTESLRNVIMWAYHNRKEIGKIGINGKKLYNTSFSNHAIAQDIAELLEAISIS